MTGSELVEEVQFIIQDASYEDDRILLYLNEGLSAVASRVDIPGLEALAEVETSTGDDSIPLPADYMRDIKYVNSVTNECKITVAGRAMEYLKFRRRHPFAESGSSVVDVGVRAKRLYYYPTPSTAETLQIAYFKQPEAFTLSTTPDVLPAHLQRKLLCSYAAGVIYSQIEDGIEGQQVNTTRQWQHYVDAIGELIDYIGDADAEPVQVAEDYGW